MLRAVKNKLKDRSGASLMVGLLFFVTCAVVGSVILAAASSSMGRISGLSKTDQSRYAVRSAAKLVRKQIQNMEYTSANVIGRGFGQSETNNPQNLTDIFEIMADQNLRQYWEDGYTEDFTDGTIQSLWDDAVASETETDSSGKASYNTTDINLKDKRKKGRTYEDYSENLVFTVKDGSADTDDADGISKVNVSATMHSDFSIDIVISGAKSSTDSSPEGGEDVSLHATPYISMTFDSVNAGGSFEEETRQISTSITWTVNEADEQTDSGSS